MTLDVQWFIYALVDNGALSVEDAVAIYASLGGNADLEQFAQAVLERLAANCDEESANALLEQIQEVVNYAAVQGATGNPPPLEIPESVPEAAPAPPPPAPPPPLLPLRPSPLRRKLPNRLRLPPPARADARDWSWTPPGSSPRSKSTFPPSTGMRICPVWPIRVPWTRRLWKSG